MRSRAATGPSRRTFSAREAPFPAGPFILASLLKCGVVTLFAVREGNRILIKCEPFADEVKLPRRGREAELFAPGLSLGAEA